MLKHLAISNYALIDSLSMSFDDGFSVITGETGAGKSILLGALGFVLGDRSDSSIMLDETKKCAVEATFVVDDLELELGIGQKQRVVLRVDVNQLAAQLFQLLSGDWCVVDKSAATTNISV